MSSLNFPQNPEIGDPYLGWVWNGSSWVNKAEAITTADVALTNPQRAELNTQEDANQYLAEHSVYNDQKNDVAEGQFRLVWDHSYDPDFPFNGSIGYDGNNDDPDSVGGSFLYAHGTRGTVSIGRDGDMELHGPSEIKGVPDRDGHLPWITDFEYVQAADFKDADGNSIIGQGGGASVHIGEAPPEDPQEGQQWLETPADGDAKMWVYDGAVWLEQPSNASGATVGTSAVMLEPDARNVLPPDLTTQKDVNLYLSGALDKLLDDDGNPIGGGGDSAIKAEWMGEDGETFLWWLHYRDPVETPWAYRIDPPTDDPNNSDDRASIVSAYGTSHFHRITTSELKARSIRTIVDSHAANTPDSHCVFTGTVFAGNTHCVENRVYGGINILGADAERPDGLPYSPDEKSVQYALTVSHETLGRTVEIDKEGIIRANQFTDMAGNPLMQTLTQAEYDALTPNPNTVYFIV